MIKLLRGKKESILEKVEVTFLFGELFSGS